MLTDIFLSKQTLYIYKYKYEIRQDRTTLRSFGERCQTEVGFNAAELWEELLGLVVVNGGGNDDVVTGDPVNRGGDFPRESVTSL